MKKLLTAIVIALMCKFSTGQKLVGNYYDYGKIHPREQYYVNSAGQKSGSYKLYNENGVIIKEYNYLNGVENGLCIDYVATDNNQRVVAAKGSFINGQPDGAYVQYCDEDGYKSKVQEGRFKNGKKTGFWKEWWCTKINDKAYVSILKSAGSYKDGNCDGVWTYYNETGTLDKRGAYKDGKEDGIWNFYDNNDSTKVLYKGEYRGGEKVGLWRVYINSDLNETEDKSQFAGYKIINFNGDRGQNDTVEIIYYMTGEKFSETHFMPGRGPFGNTVLQKGGPYIRYYTNGKVGTTGYYLLRASNIASLSSYKNPPRLFDITNRIRPSLNR